MVLEYGVPAHKHVTLKSHLTDRFCTQTPKLSPFLEHDLVPARARLSRDQLLQVSDRVLLTDTQVKINNPHQTQSNRDFRSAFQRILAFDSNLLPQPVVTHHLDHL